MSVQVYGCNHVAIEVDDIDKAVTFYKDVFNLEQMRGGEGDAFFKLGEHQFLAIFEVEKVQRANMRHFGVMVRVKRSWRKFERNSRRNTNSNSSRRSAAIFAIRGVIASRSWIFTTNRSSGFCLMPRCKGRALNSTRNDFIHRSRA